jgi:hypothetical protein
MKAKRITLVIAAAAVALALGMILGGCLKFSLNQTSIENRLKEDGYTVSYLSASDEITGYLGQGISVTTMLSASKSESNDQIEGGLETFFVKVFFCGDETSAKWVEEKIAAYKDAAGYNSDKNIVIYRYEKVVMVGDYVSVSIARTY